MIAFSTILFMFVRKNKNSSGSISIQIIEKAHGKYKVVETIGCSKDKNEVEKIFKLGIYPICN